MSKLINSSMLALFFACLPSLAQPAGEPTWRIGLSLASSNPGEDLDGFDTSGTLGLRLQRALNWTGQRVFFFSAEYTFDSDFSLSAASMERLALIGGLDWYESRGRWYLTTAIGYSRIDLSDGLLIIIPGIPIEGPFLDDTSHGIMAGVGGGIEVGNGLGVFARYDYHFEVAEDGEAVDDLDGSYLHLGLRYTF